MTGSSGEENARLYERGVNDGYNDELLEARSLLDILDVFGEDGLRSYLVGVLEGEEDRREDDAEVDPDAVEVITDYETGEETPHRPRRRGRSSRRSWPIAPVSLA